MRPTHSLLIAVTVSLACGSSTVATDAAAPTDDAAAPALLPLDPGCASQVLTADNVPMWLAYAACSPQTMRSAIELQIEAARGDEGILDAMFTVIDTGWTFDGVTQIAPDVFGVTFVIGMVQALRDPLALDRLEALVWRPLPMDSADHEFGISVLEAAAGDALACIPTSEAQTEAQTIASTHPSHAVCVSVQQKLNDQTCAFYQ